MPIYVPAQPYPKQANDNIRSSDWNSAIDEVMRLSDVTQYLNRNTFNGPLTVSGALTVNGGLTVTGNQTVSGELTVNGLLKANAGMSGPLTVKGALTVDTTLTVTGAVTANGALTVSGALTASGGIKGPPTANGDLTIAGSALVDGSFMSISETTVLATNASGGPWASFGSNAYYRANGWKLAKTNEAGVCLRMSAVGGGNSEFRFARIEANSTSATDLATIGRDGLTVSGKLTVSGTALSELKGPVTVSGLLTAGAGLTVTGNQTVNGVLGVSTYTRISQQTSGNWAIFGANMYNPGTGTAFRLVNTAQPGANLHMSAEGGGNTQFRFCLMDAGETNQRNIATIGTEGLALSGALKAIGAGPLTVNGVLKVGSNGGMLEVGSLTIVSQNTAGSWSTFGKNFYLAENGSWLLKDTSKPGVNFHMSADGADNKEFRFTRREVGSTTNVLLAAIGTGGLTVAGGISGVDGRLTIHDSFLSVEGLGVVSTNVSSGRWASFGSNAYYRGNQWNLANTAQPGVCLVMSGTGGNTDREFAFCRMEANSTTATDLVKMGRDGIVVHNGKKVATGYEFLYMVRGQVEANGNASIGTGFTASKIGTGIYQINFNPPFSNWPIVVATQRGPENSNTRDNALIVGIGYEWAKVKVGDDSGVARDRQFTFIAVGPRTT